MLFSTNLSVQSALFHELGEIISGWVEDTTSLLVFGFIMLTTGWGGLIDVPVVNSVLISVLVMSISFSNLGPGVGVSVSIDFIIPMEEAIA